LGDGFSKDKVSNQRAHGGPYITKQPANQVSTQMNRHQFSTNHQRGEKKEGRARITHQQIRAAGVTKTAGSRMREGPKKIKKGEK